MKKNNKNSSKRQQQKSAIKKWFRYRKAGCAIIRHKSSCKWKNSRWDFMTKQQKKPSRAGEREVDDKELRFFLPLYFFHFILGILSSTKKRFFLFFHNFHCCVFMEIISFFVWLAHPTNFNSPLQCLMPWCSMKARKSIMNNPHKFVIFALCLSFLAHVPL